MGAIANAGNADEDGTTEPLELIRIGKGCTQTPRKSGNLHDFANDAWNFYDNDCGGVLLTIKRANHWELQVIRCLACLLTRSLKQQPRFANAPQYFLHFSDHGA